MSDSKDPNLSRKNNASFDDKQNLLTIKIFLGNPSSVPMALGSLELAKDMVRSLAMSLAAKEAATRGIIVPQGANGKDGIHVL